MIRRTDDTGSPCGGPSSCAGKPELLAPAGEYAGLVGAVAAGADAVYLGGERFGARAYARNFTQEELIRGIRFAHLRGVRIYLTLNTMIKEREFDALEDTLSPLDRAGLDGIIVQDRGVLKFVRECFPRIRIHASTQMAVTGVYGARYLRDKGAVRVVPARELSLEELANIRREAGVEIEAFIHGAMCYSYSGLCLFSSMLGGRSGNRGRCAGPCRLPYGVSGGKRSKGQPDTPAYPLSLRDVCTLPILDRILRSGAVDSLKIEGRMKDPAYTAGVTAVYRRAVDRIWEDPERPWRPAQDDLKILKGLYLRTDLCEGYYERHNGPSMITGSAPGYIGSDDQVRRETEERFLAGRAVLRLGVKVSLRAVTGEPLMLTLTRADGSAGTAGPRPMSVTVSGQTVESASKHAATEEQLIDQLDRFGGSDYVPEAIEADLSEDAFVPAAAVNVLRRQACEEMTERILSEWEAQR
ncbi:MAG: U32 family peptidase [Lachnospiraceae bacterium]|nr:U32 family peptidase [Lachnospiraceae bacterium]